MSWEIEAYDEEPRGDSLDWTAIKAQIVEKLDVAAEFTSLGVRFARPSHNAKGWRECHAVSRKDENPSAAVNVFSAVYSDRGGDGEKLHLFQFAVRYGSGFGRWIDAARHYAEKAGVEIGRFVVHSKGRIREGEFDYFDPSGALRYRVFRYRLPNGKKDFSQHPPDGKGGWKHGTGCMDGVDPLPYRLPDLLAHPDAPVWICEGEHCCDRLVREGRVATTGHGGSQAFDRTWVRFKPEWFAGRICYLIPDDDPGGLRHMERVGRWLKSVAKSVKLVLLPDLPIKGDVVDWFDQRGTVAELDALAAAAPEWEPPPEQEPPPRRAAHLGDLRLLMAGVHWIWEGWLPTARIAGLAALEGTGKTRMMLDLARRIWFRLPWPDGQGPSFPEGTPTLWVCSDGNQDDLAMAVTAMGLPDEAVFLNTLPEDPYGGTDLDDPDALKTLDDLIPLVKPAFVVIDSLTYATRHDLGRQSDMKILMTPLKELAQRHKVTIIPQLHLSKEGQALGRRIRGVTRTLLHLDCPDPDNQPDRRKLWVEKSFARKPPALGVTMSVSGNEYDNEPPSGDGGGARGVGRPPGERDRARQFILDALADQDERRAMELKNEFIDSGGSEGTFWRVRDDMVSAGEITCDGKPKMMRLVRQA